MFYKQLVLHGIANSTLSYLLAIYGIGMFFYDIDKCYKEKTNKKIIWDHDLDIDPEDFKKWKEDQNNIKK